MPPIRFSRWKLAVGFVTAAGAACFLVGRIKLGRSISFHSLGEVTIPLDGWSLSHFVLYTILGYLFPRNYLVFLMLGVAFELVEEMGGIIERHMERKRADRREHRTVITSTAQKPWVLDGGGEYWFGRLSDPLVNSLGFLMGMQIHDTLKGQREARRVSGREALYLGGIAATSAALWVTVVHADQEMGLRKRVRDAYQRMRQRFQQTIEASSPLDGRNAHFSASS